MKIQFKFSLTTFRRKETNRNDVTVFLVICIDSINQTEIRNEHIKVEKLMRNIVFFSTHNVNFKLITNKKEELDAFISACTFYNSSITITEVSLPLDLQEIIMAYKPCVSAKIFVHEMFPEIDSGIVLDTDIVIMEDIGNLWKIFEKFDDHHFAAIAPVETHYSNVDNFPYYGPVGK